MKKIISFLSLIIFIILPLNVEAGSLSISASTNSVIVGNSVIISVKATNVAGTISLTSSNGSILSGGASGMWIENETKVFTFRANSAGTVNVTVTPTNMGDFDNNGSYTASKSVTINVKNKPMIVLSTDNNLSSLGIEGYTLTPEFNKDTLEYSATIAPDTTSINVVATPNHGGATVTGNGVREVTDGDNRIEINVTAENGTSKTYVINAKVEEYNPIEVDMGEEKYTVVRKKSLITPPENYTETSVTINNEEVPAYYSEITKYTLVALKNSEGKQEFYIYDNGNYKLYKELTFNQIKICLLDMPSVPDLYEKGIFVYNDENINAYKISPNSSYSLIYGMNVETGNKNYYIYDSNENTIQIYNTEEISKLNEKIEYMIYIIIGLLGFSFILLITTLIVVFKKSSKREKKNKKVETDEIKVEKVDVK